MKTPPMTKNYMLPCALITCLLSAGLASVELRAQEVLPIPAAQTAIVVDGEAEDEWERMPYQQVEHVYGGTIEDEADFSAAWKAMWDQENIYVFFHVTDEALYNLGSGAEKFWLHDCAEIFFDLLNDKDQVDTDDAPDDDNYQYRFIWGLDDEAIKEAPPSTGMENVSLTRTEGSDTLGYDIEVKIPWAALAADHPFGMAEKGKQIGTEVKVADLDNPTVPAGVYSPDAELLWNNPTKQHLKVTSSFGTIQLAGTLTGDADPPLPISDLGAEATGTTSAVLRWTSPADENAGRAAAYELCWGEDSALVSQWLSTSTRKLPILPLMPGQEESYLLDSLEAGSAYFLALRSTDPFGNISLVSNVSRVRTFDPDLLPPDPVTDLRLDSSSAFMAMLSWTAPGDDGSDGSATIYDLRVHGEILTLENWEDATPLTGLPLPLEAGQPQKFTVRGLQPEHTYYFALRTADEAPNYSAISNVVDLSTPAFAYQVLHPVGQMIGTNSFIDVPMDKMEALSFIREYHPWSFTEIEDDVFEFNRWNGFWDFDKYYVDLHDRGIMVCPALWSSPDWLEPRSTNKPCGDGEDPTDPASYSEMSQLMFQYAARYGHREVDESLLMVNEGQVKKSGMGVLDYYEDWNEQDRDWEGRDAQFLAEEYAAMASANVDGHGGTLGEGLGLKTADPQARFVMGGLYILGTEYISEMYDWFLENRPDHRWPIDVINMHHYAYSYTRKGLSPEEDGYKEMVMDVINWRNAYAPENEVWITEFGYDTNDESPNRINPFGGFTQEEIQAQWITRTYLILASCGVDRAAQFMLRDTDDDSEPRWSDCGLTLSSSEDYLPKASWYYAYSLKQLLADMYFDGVVSESASAYVYRFKDAASDRYTYALWSPTSEGLSSSYRLKIPSGATSLRKISLKEGYTEGVSEFLDSSAELLNVDISETPVFIVADYGEPTGEDHLLPHPGLQAYPNPCTDELQLRMPGEGHQSPLELSLFSASGSLIWHQGIHPESSVYSMQTGELAKGLYILKVRSGSGVSSMKIMKQ